MSVQTVAESATALEPSPVSAFTFAPRQPGSDADDVKKISDGQFMTEVQRLRDLSSFLNNEAVVVSLPEEDMQIMGYLFTLVESSRGRAPTGPEWAAVAKYNRLLFQIISESQRRRFLLGRISVGFARLPLVLAIVPLISLLGSLLIVGLAPESDMPEPVMFAAVTSFYLFWLMSLGAIGSIAFIGMNALAVQQDITFDLLNSRLIYLRVALGALFSLILTLPYGSSGFFNFILSLLGKAHLTSAEQLLLVIPFLLGFSTSLVIMILNRLLEAAQSFFGKTVIATAPSDHSTHTTSSSSALFSTSTGNSAPVSRGWDPLSGGWGPAMPQKGHKRSGPKPVSSEITPRRRRAAP
jgi:hypothetical protein